KKRNDGNITLADHVFERDGERVPQLRIFGIGDVEVVRHHKLVQQVLGHLAVHREAVPPSGELGDGPGAGDDRESRNAGDENVSTWSLPKNTITSGLVS